MYQNSYVVMTWLHQKNSEVTSQYCQPALKKRILYSGHTNYSKESISEMFSGNSLNCTDIFHILGIKN